MDISPVTSFALGTATGLAVIGLLAPSINRRLHGRCRAGLAELELALRELRQERADDRETNRRLRRELAIKTPANFEATRQERDWALDELDKLSTELQAAATELADRDRSLRQARLAIHEIRAQLEADRFNGAAAAVSRPSRAADDGPVARTPEDGGPAATVATGGGGGSPVPS